MAGFQDAFEPVLSYLETENLFSVVLNESEPNWGDSLQYLSPPLVEKRLVFVIMLTNLLSTAQIYSIHPPYRQHNYEPKFKQTDFQIKQPYFFRTQCR